MTRVQTMVEFSHVYSNLYPVVTPLLELQMRELRLAYTRSTQRKRKTNLSYVQHITMLVLVV